MGGYTGGINSNKAVIPVTQDQSHETTNTNKLQDGSNKIENQSISDTLEKMERDRKNAYISGVQNSATTFISSMAQNKISF